MALRADYCTASELKAFMRITDTADDTAIGLAITSASRAIDQVAGRSFGQDDPAIARYYSATRGSGSSHPAGTNDPFAGRWTLDVDDVSTTTDLVVKTDSADDGTFETTLTINTDYRLWPYNAAADGRPWERIVLTAGGSLPTYLRAIEVTAKWGWTAVPSDIKLATQIQAQTILKGGRDSPLGIAGSPDFGNEMRLSTKLHPNAAELVRPYVKIWGVA